jgi:UDP-glucose 4-epimerase
MKILVTGAAGYIGTHLLLELQDRGYDDVSVIDMHLRTSPNWIGELISGEACGSDLLNRESGSTLNWVLRQQYDVVIHLAAFISVEESMALPTLYWRNNLLSTSRIIENLKGAHLIFASTGTAFCPENAYAYSKLACEEEIRAHVKDYTIFRFFNVSGVREGVFPTGRPTHLIRRAAMAATGELDELVVAGNDWDTPDGTAVRDYIHAIDLAASIANAIEAGPANTEYEGLGSGTGYSVLEVIESMKKVSQVDFHVTIGSRRVGDVGKMICSSQYPHISLKHDLDSMCLSAYEGIRNASK